MKTLVFYLCARIPHGNGSASDEADEEEEERHELAVENALAIVTDGSGYTASFMVRPEFGCVLHEEKGTG